ncbi:MAG TPA: hypothetical protein EYH29_07830 [Caldilineales bacterium]|nr:hypothetical protein [Caldilineales bacterium]
MRRTIFILTILITIIGQLFLATGLQPRIFAGGGGAPAADAEPLFLPPTARPSLTPSVTPTQAATDTPAPTPTQPPGGGPNPTPTPVPPTSTPTPAPPMAVIAQKVVNVRMGPGLIYDVIGVARESERYLIMGQFPPGDWLQIDFHGRKGWVFRQLVTVEGGENRIPPVTDIPPTPTFTPSPSPTSTDTPSPTATPASTKGGDTPAPPAEPPPTAPPAPPEAVIVGQNVPIRAGPGLIYNELGLANQGESYPITGLSVTGDWLQIDYKGEPGWVFLIQAEPQGDLEQVPVIEEIPPTPTFTPAPPTETPTPPPEGTGASSASQPPGGGSAPPLALLILGGLVSVALAAGIGYYYLRKSR